MMAACPRGLEYLMQLDRVLVHQQIELFEALTGYETENKYAIKNGRSPRREGGVVVRACSVRQADLLCHGGEWLLHARLLQQESRLRYEHCR